MPNLNQRVSGIQLILLTYYQYSSILWFLSNFPTFQIWKIVEKIEKVVVFFASHKFNIGSTNLNNRDKKLNCCHCYLLLILLWSPMTINTLTISSMVTMTEQFLMNAWLRFANEHNNSLLTLLNSTHNSSLWQ